MAHTCGGIGLQQVNASIGRNADRYGNCSLRSASAGIAGSDEANNGISLSSRLNAANSLRSVFARVLGGTMIDCRKIGITLLYTWSNGSSMHFRLSELKDASVTWVIGFLNQLHGRPAISIPEFKF